MNDLFGKLVSFVGGAAIAVTFGVLGVEALRDYRTFDDAPRRTTLLGAVEASAHGRQWVTVEGAAWRCGQLARNVDGGAAFLPATEDGAVVVARFDRVIRCDAIAARPLTGIIEPMAPKRAVDLRAAGMEVPEGARLRTLDVCTSCGKGNARLGVVICSLFVILGLALYPLGSALLAMQGRAQAALHGAIQAPPALSPGANRTVRAWGLAALVAGALAVAVGEGYVLYGVVPMRGFGGFAMLLGGWMVAFPGSYRRVVARVK